MQSPTVWSYIISFLIIVIPIAIIIISVKIKESRGRETNDRFSSNDVQNDIENIENVRLSVQDKLQNGENKIATIRFVREQTGLGLEDAKNLVDVESIKLTYLNENNGEIAPTSDEVFDTIVEKLEARESKIEVIMYVRAETGFGLKEAKDFVEDVLRTM